MNFSLEGLNYISNTIWIDSTVINGTDSVFYLNRIVTACDTCPATYRLCNQPDFLKKIMYKRSGGKYEFRYPGSVLIKTLASAGQSWLYDTVNSITATVSSVTQQPVFGITDSVKGIHLSNGGVIWLSKNHGLLQFTGLPVTMVYSLRGIEGRNIGDLVPKFAQIYNYQVGDVLQYKDKSINYGMGYGYGHLNKITILTRDSSAGYYSYSIREVSCAWIVQIIGYTHDTTHSYELTTMSFQDSASDLSNYYPSQIVEDPVGQGVIGPATAYFQTGLDNKGIYYKMIGSLFYGEPPVYVHGSLVTPPMPYELLLPDYSMDAFASVYKAGLGNTYHEAGIFEAYSYNELIGYVRNGDTVGTVYPDDYILAGSAGGLESGSLHVFPNPTSGELNIAGLNSGVEGLITITDIFGRKVMSSAVRPKISVSSLDPGVYFLLMTDSRGGVCRPTRFIRK